MLGLASHALMQVPLAWCLVLYPPFDYPKGIFDDIRVFRNRVFAFAVKLLPCQWYCSDT